MAIPNFDFFEFDIQEMKVGPALIDCPRTANKCVTTESIAYYFCLATAITYITIAFVWEPFLMELLQGEEIALRVLLLEFISAKRQSTWKSLVIAGVTGATVPIQIFSSQSFLTAFLFPLE